MPTGEPEYRLGLVEDAYWTLSPAYWTLST